MGFASSRAQSRNFINQGHVLVNGVRVNIPSFQIKVGDVVGFKDKFQKNPLIDLNIKFAQSLNRNPGWITPDYSKITGEVISLPKREHVDLPVKEQVIVELYSK
jgi:small subunit ribosomal protein S4